MGRGLLLGGEGVRTEGGRGASWVPVRSAPVLLVASGNTPPIFNTTIEYVSEDLLIGERAASGGLGGTGGARPGLTPPLSPGQVAFVLTATDLDKDTLSYSISGADAFYFNVNQSTGVVTLRNLLDREVRARSSSQPGAAPLGVGGTGGTAPGVPASSCAGAERALPCVPSPRPGSPSPSPCPTASTTR